MPRLDAAHFTSSDDCSGALVAERSTSLDDCSSSSDIDEVLPPPLSPRVARVGGAGGPAPAPAPAFVAPPAPAPAVTPAVDAPAPTPRHCYCDRIMWDCDSCSRDLECADHDWITCGGCDRWFHLECTGWTCDRASCTISPGWDPSVSLSTAVGSQDPWFCITCWEARKRNTPPLPWSACSLGKRALCLGIAYEPPPAGMGPNALGQHRSRWNRRLRTRVNHLQHFVDASTLSAILASTPRPHPTHRPMSASSRHLHCLHTRAFELSMLCFHVESCSCCGRTEPVHDNPLLAALHASHPQFHLRHLQTGFHQAWFCSCARCDGGQYYCQSRSSHAEFFCNTHGGDDHLPEYAELLGTDGPNAQLCDYCHKEFSTDLLELNYTRRFSSRNGYGPTPVPPDLLPADPYECSQVEKWRELDALLDASTSAEESAIRPIAPLTSIVRLKHGNIGCKGVTSCVWQESWLNLVLPNLPSSVMVLVIKYPRRGGGRGPGGAMKSYRCRRLHIARILTLLSSLDCAPWNRITVLEDNLAAWPEDGNLLDMANVPAVDEVLPPSEASPAPAAPSPPPGDAVSAPPALDALDDPDLLICDGGDLGLAPLQADVSPKEIVEGTTAMGSGTPADSSSLALATLAIDSALQAATSGAAHPSSFTRPEVVLERDGEEAHVLQSNLLPTGDFVKMGTKRFSYSMAFPTVFCPAYVDGRWTIPGDFTAWHTPRHRCVPKPDWHRWLMWRSDGRPAAHPTFALFLDNDSRRSQLQSQGCIALRDVDPTLTVSEFMAQWQAGSTGAGGSHAPTGGQAGSTGAGSSHAPTGGQAGSTGAGSSHAPTGGHRDIRRKIQYYAGNVRSTDQYWMAVKNDFLATALYHSFVRDCETRIFHSGSHSEFHDPHLRRVLAKYAAKVQGNPGVYDTIMEESTAFHKAIHRYKTVVTHFLVCKMETWILQVLSPVLGLDHCRATIEFGSTRGSCHFHLIGNVLPDDTSQAIDDAIADWAMAMNDAVVALDTAIAAAHDPVLHPGFDDVLRDPGDKPQEAMEARLKFAKLHVPDAHALHEATMADSRAAAVGSVTRIMEDEYGYSAEHPGVAPGDWPAPGGRGVMGYRSAHSGMMSRRDVLAKKELRQPKFCRERHLCERSVNLTNQSFCHCCSDYCWRCRLSPRRFDPASHTDTDPTLHTKPDGTRWLLEKQHYCRFGFGDKQRYDPSGHGNLTEGKPAVRSATIDIDGNNLPQFQAMRNHPRVLQEPVITKSWGCNSDLKHFLTNHETHRRVVARDDGLAYPAFLRNLQLAGLDGLEQFSGAETIDHYLTGYGCKGSSSSSEWDRTLNTLGERCCESARGSLPFRSLVSKFMNSMCGSRSVPRDEPCFTLAGGLLTYNTMPVRKCSVNQISIEALVGDATSLVAFNFKNLVAKYRQRADGLSGVCLFVFAAHHFLSGGRKCVPNFFGFHNRPSWPLPEECSKWMLVLCKPWRANYDELKVNGSFAEALAQHMWQPGFPRKIAVQIDRKRAKWDYDDAAGDGYGDGDEDPVTSQASNRQNSVNDEAAGAAVMAADAGYGLDDENQGDLGNLDFANLPDGGPDLDWSVGYDANVVGRLGDHKTAFYASQMADSRATVRAFFLLFVLFGTCLSLMSFFLRFSAHAQVGTGISLHEEDKYRPENCRGHAQKLLVGHHILVMRRWREHFAGATDVAPDSVFTYVQGNPGTGKSFVITTQHNITRAIMRHMGRDIATAPTGCAAALINGVTCCRALRYPCGRKLLLPPSDLAGSDASTNAHYFRKWCDAVHLTMDESSMLGRPPFAWAAHRCKEARSPKPNASPDQSAAAAPHPLPAEIYDRPFGGIPTISLFGDCQQLPAVAMKSLFDRSAPTKMNSSDACGRVAFHEYLHPVPGTGVQGVAVVMDEIIRQDGDANMRNFIGEMRTGTMGASSIDFALSRNLRTLPVGEREEFERSALCLMQTWRETVPITVKYLQQLQKPVARIDTQCGCPANRQNHAIEECNWPAINALCEGAVVMLLINIIVEEKLMNGSVGTIIAIICANSDGPRERRSLPAYVTVDFPHWETPESKKLLPGCPRTWAPIEPSTFRCERMCCSATTIPLRVCKALTVHKSQGMSVGPSQVWKRVVVCMAESGRRRTPGVEQVAFSRAEDGASFAVTCPVDLTREMFQRIGQGASYEKRREFENDLRALAFETQAPIIEMIRELDPGPALARSLKYQGVTFFYKYIYHVGFYTDSQKIGRWRSLFWDNKGSKTRLQQSTCK